MRPSDISNKPIFHNLRFIGYRVGSFALHNMDVDVVELDAAKLDGNVVSSWDRSEDGEGDPGDPGGHVVGVTGGEASELGAGVGEGCVGRVGRVGRVGLGVGDEVKAALDTDADVLDADDLVDRDRDRHHWDHSLLCRASPSQAVRLAGSEALLGRGRPRQAMPPWATVLEDVSTVAGAHSDELELGELGAGELERLGGPGERGDVPQREAVHHSTWLCIFARSLRSRGQKHMTKRARQSKSIQQAF